MDNLFIVKPRCLGEIVDKVYLSINSTFKIVLILIKFLYIHPLNNIIYFCFTTNNLRKILSNDVSSFQVDEHNNQQNISVFNHLMT
jgi:hypothetical protein